MAQSKSDTFCSRCIDHNYVTKVFLSKQVFTDKDPGKSCERPNSNWSQVCAHFQPISYDRKGIWNPILIKTYLAKGFIIFNSWSRLYAWTGIIEHSDTSAGYVESPDFINDVINTANIILIPIIPMFGLLLTCMFGVKWHFYMP